MAHEYKLMPAHGQPADLNIVGHALRGTGRYELLGVSDQTLSGALLSSSRDAKWPEDFSVSVEDKTWLITIHGGTASQRQQLLLDLQDSFAEQRPHCDLEEP